MTLIALLLSSSYSSIHPPPPHPSRLLAFSSSIHAHPPLFNFLHFSFAIHAFPFILVLSTFFVSPSLSTPHFSPSHYLITSILSNYIRETVDDGSMMGGASETSSAKPAHAEFDLFTQLKHAANSCPGDSVSAPQTQTPHSSEVAFHKNDNNSSKGDKWEKELAEFISDCENQPVSRWLYSSPADEDTLPQTKPSATPLLVPEGPNPTAFQFRTPSPYRKWPVEDIISQLKSAANSCTPDAAASPQLESIRTPFSEEFVPETVPPSYTPLAAADSAEARLEAIHQKRKLFAKTPCPKQHHVKSPNTPGFQVETPTSIQSIKARTTIPRPDWLKSSASLLSNKRRKVEQKSACLSSSLDALNKVEYPPRHSWNWVEREIICVL